MYYLSVTYLCTVDKLNTVLQTHSPLPKEPFGLIFGVWIVPTKPIISSITWKHKPMNFSLMNVEKEKWLEIVRYSTKIFPPIKSRDWVMPKSCLESKWQYHQRLRPDSLWCENPYVSNEHLLHFARLVCNICHEDCWANFIWWWKYYQWVYVRIFIEFVKQFNHFTQ